MDKGEFVVEEHEFNIASSVEYFGVGVELINILSDEKKVKRLVIME